MLKLISDDNLDRENKLLAKRRDVQKLVKYNSCSTIFADRLFAFPGMTDILHRYDIKVKT
jgi:hypothetical protein